MGFIKDNLIWLLPVVLGGTALSVGSGDIVNGAVTIGTSIMWFISSFIFGVTFTGLNSATTLTDNTIEFSSFNGVQSSPTNLFSLFASENLTTSVKYEVSKVGEDYLFNRNYIISVGAQEVISPTNLANLQNYNASITCNDVYAGGGDECTSQWVKGIINSAIHGDSACKVLLGEEFSFKSGVSSSPSTSGCSFYPSSSGSTVFNNNCGYRSYWISYWFTSMTCSAPDLVGNSNKTISKAQLNNYLGEDLQIGDSIISYYINPNFEIDLINYEFDSLVIYNSVFDKYKLVYRIGNERFVIDNLESITGTLKTNLASELLLIKGIDTNSNNLVSMVSVNLDDIELYDKIESSLTCNKYSYINTNSNSNFKEIGTSCGTYNDSNRLALISLKSFANPNIEKTQETRTVSDRVKLSLITTKANTYQNSSNFAFKIVSDTVFRDIKTTNSDLTTFTKDRLTEYILVENGDYEYKLRLNNKTINLNDSQILILGLNSSVALAPMYEVVEYDFNNLGMKGFQMRDNLNYSLNTDDSKITLFGMSGENNNISTTQIKEYSFNDYLLNFVDLTTLHNNLNYADYVGATNTYESSEFIYNVNTSLFYVQDLQVNSNQQIFSSSEYKINYESNDYETFYYLENPNILNEICLITELDSTLLNNVGVSICSNSLYGVKSLTQNKIIAVN